MFIIVKMHSFGHMLTLQFKHVKFKYLIRRSSVKQSDSQMYAQLYAQKASEILGCSPATARLLVTKNNKITKLDLSNVIENIEFCKKHLKLSDVIEFPSVIAMRTNLLHHRFYSLYELGCVNVTAYDILKFPHYMKMTPSDLLKKGISFSINEHIDCYINFILHSETDNNIIAAAENLYCKGQKLSEIKKHMNAEFLSRKLACSFEDIQGIFNKYPLLCIQSISNMDLLLDTLIKKLEFSSEKILKIPFLLTLHHDDLENLLSTSPEILGISIKFLADKNPAILKKSPDVIKKIGDLLNFFNINKDQLLCCPKIMLFSPDALLDRLNYLCRAPDFRLLTPYRKFLWLVYYYNNLNERLNHLEASCVPFSLNAFTVSKAKFDKYLWVKELRSNVKDSCFYLSRVFNCSDQEVLLKLQEYPYSMKSSIRNISSVINFLLNSGVSTKQLWNGLSIIFYEEEVVKSYFNNLKYFPEYHPFSEWVRHYNFIQLLIYTIEVDTGFRGDRVFIANARIEQPEVLSALNCAV